MDFQQHCHDFWKETLLLTFSNVFFFAFFFWLLLLWAPKDCFFSFLKKNPFLVQVLNLSRRYAGSGGEHRGLMGIKQQGKQASKLKQKPQTWPRVNRKSLVTCQAASGVITPNTMGFITLNYTHTTEATGLSMLEKSSFKTREHVLK